MHKRKTTEDYHALAKERGFLFKGDAPKNTKRKATWVCNDGHEFRSPYNSIQQRNGCPHCASQSRKNIAAMKKRQRSIEGKQKAPD